MNRCAKIVATIGPACQDEATLQRLLEAGVDVARLNFSHGTHEDHAAVIARLRNTARSMGRSICILQDLQGPKIRTGVIQGGSVHLTPGQEFTLTTLPVPGSPQEVSVDFPGLAQAVVPGGRILLDDGNLELQVISTSSERALTRVILGGDLKSHKGVNLPRAQLDIPSFTEKDEADLAFGLEQGIDMVAMSFVKVAKDVERVREAIQRLSPHRQVPIIAKLERPEALDNLESIVLAADGVMVARGDLGVEMSPQEVPIAQKCIIDCANRNARVVITATQMLDSMIHNPRPTRAEASDVANAVFDGTDAVMLSGETASGEYPVESVQMMDAIVREAEANSVTWGHWKGLEHPDQEQGAGLDDTYYLTLAARELGRDRNVAAIAVFTQSGRSALLMSKARPGVPILAFTPNLDTYQRIGVYWGVTPYLVPQADTIKAMLIDVEAAMIASTSVQVGQRVILICGFPVDAVRPTNMALLHTVGER